MKKVSLILVAMLLGISAMTYANGPEKNFGNRAHEVVKDIIKIDFDPTFKRKGDKLYLNVLNLDQENVIIKVYDSERRLIYKETFENSLIIEKAINFEQAYEDDYLVVVVDNDKAFREVVTIK